MRERKRDFGGGWSPQRQCAMAMAPLAGMLMSSRIVLE